MTECDEIVIVMDNLSKWKKNSIATNITSTSSINCQSKKSNILWYFAHSFISDYITTDNYFYFPLLYNTKIYNTKWKIRNLEKVLIKNHTCYNFDDIINLENFNLDNVLIAKESRENVLIYDISYQTLIEPRRVRIKFEKIDGFISIYDGTRYFTLFTMTLLTTEVNIF